MTTEADKKLANADDYIAKAGRELSAIVLDHCEGIQDYNDNRRDTIEDVFHALVKLRRQLERSANA